MLKKVLKRLSENKLLVAVLVIGTLAWSVTMVKSGILYKYGMGFWGANGHDGIWHVALINSLSKPSLQMPIFAGESLRNYHIGYDLLLAIIHKITFLPVITLYFQILPPVMALLTGILVYKLVYLWRKSNLQAVTATFFVYFSGSFGWIVTYIKAKTFDGESIFWAQQSLSTLINPPFALSLIVMFLGFYLLLKANLKKMKLKSIIAFSLLFGILAQIKIYSGILVLSALFFGGIWEYFRERDLSLMKMFLMTLLVTILVLLPTYDLRSGGLLFQPFWFLESMVSNPDRFYWPKMATALINYKESGNIIKGTAAYTLVLVIFLVGNLGIRVVSLPYIGNNIKNLKKIDLFEAMILPIVIFGFLIPTLFIQKGNSWNSIQFFYYTLVFLSLISGVVVGRFLEKIKRGRSNINFNLYAVFVLLILFSIPTAVSTLRHYLPSRPPSRIPSEEMAALKFLSQQADGIVLTVPFNRQYAESLNLTPPKPLYLYESTAYVSALSGKVTYLEDEVNLEITGYPWKIRKAEIIGNFDDIKYLQSKGIKYIYVPNADHFIFKDEMEGYTIYNKGNIAVYKI